MRHRNNSSATATAPTTSTDAAGMDNWNSPIPYLFGGLALMLGLIAMALIILACSYRKPSFSSATTSGAAADDDHGHRKSSAKQVDVVVDSEPNTVVILAGQANPTHLANPVSSTQHLQPV